MTRKTILMLAFFSVLTFGLNFQHVVTPTYLNEIGLDESLYGYLFAFMALGYSLSASTAGKLGEKHGTKIPIFIGLVGYGISQILFAYFQNIYVLVLIRLIAGLSIASALTNILSYVSKTTEKSERAKAMSYYVALSLLNVSIAYKVGGILGIMMPVRHVFYLQGAFVVVLAFLSLLIPSYKIITKDKVEIIYKKILTFRLVRILFIYFLVSSSFIATKKFLDVYIIDLGYSTKDLGDYIFITGILSIVVTLFVLPNLSKILKEVTIMKFALLIGFLSLGITFNFFNNIFLGLYSFYFLFIMTTSSYDPMHNSYISKLYEENQGQIIGISQSVKGLGMFIGPIVWGYIYDYDKNLIFNVATILLLLAFLILLFEKGEQYES